MSRGIVYDPVAQNQTTTKISSPPLVKAVSVAYDPVCRTFSGTQTAVMDLPPTR